MTHRTYALRDKRTGGTATIRLPKKMKNHHKHLAHLDFIEVVDEPDLSKHADILKDILWP